MWGVNGSVAWRAALVQGLAVAASSVVLALALPRSFFEDYGWAAGPGVWGAVRVLTAAVSSSGIPVLAGAALAGIPTLVTVLLGAALGGCPARGRDLRPVVRVAGGARQTMAVA